MTSPKKPGVAFWATVVVVIVAMYPLSMGPACWASSRTGLGTTIVSTVFRPLVANSPRRVRDLFQQYSRCGAKRYWSWEHLGSIPTATPGQSGNGIVIVWASDEAWY
jgi:hypothetical protein